jgi:fatty-acyl-CoA synthase
MTGETLRYGYADAHDRILRMGAALNKLGMTESDRVATLCWNTRQHFELFYAVPCAGGILHTVNPRLSADHIVYIVNHGGAEILVFDTGCAEVVAEALPRLTNVKTLIVVDDGSEPPKLERPCLRYETLVAETDPLPGIPEFDEKAGAVLCYTSGTTGNPKGVLYSHRSLVLIAIASIAKDFFGGYRNGALDAYMPIAGMFHATGWSFPHTAPISGGKLVLPGRQHDPESLCRLMAQEDVTIAGAVPTVLLGLIDWLDEHGEELPGLRSFLSSGSRVPQSLIERWESKGVDIVQTWGMTESLCSSKGTLRPGFETLDREQQLASKTKTARASWGTRLRIVDDYGEALPQDGKAVGHLEARGPWTASGYFNEEADPLSADGWLKTGDMATIDPDGYLEIKDRSKDIIKSGGEWISTTDLESAALSFPGIKYAAVIGIPHPKWQERPLLIVQSEKTANGIEATMLLEHVASQVVKWWIPDRVETVTQMPISATGKILKSELRKAYPA